GRKVHPKVRAIVFPATQDIILKSIELGYYQTLIEANVAISTPTCGPCLGGHCGILADNEVCISTTNRNFVGRMGHIDSKIYLASPYIAAASAVMGRIASPEEL
ncbi:MAG: 3-isopropylmalate dehydratase large subunit, partial [Candidatus Gastranaerophilales bacterium]|nr:3-isopropylmalate dehydratase large subunit [Candidatus Gastranaerophilales bacterium]